MRHSLFRIAFVGLLSGTAPALACSQPDLGPEVYCGTYRGDVKTSFYKTPNGRLGTFFHYDTLADLLDNLPSDEDMRQLTVWRPEGPATRLPEEQMNVQVPVYLVAI